MKMKPLSMKFPFHWGIILLSL